MATRNAYQSDGKGVQVRKMNPPREALYKKEEQTVSELGGYRPSCVLGIFNKGKRKREEMKGKKNTQRVNARRWLHSLGHSKKGKGGLIS